MVVLSKGKVWLKETYFQQSSSCLVNTAIVITTNIGICNLQHLQEFLESNRDRSKYYFSKSYSFLHTWVQHMDPDVSETFLRLN